MHASSGRCIYMDDLTKTTATTFDRARRRFAYRRLLDALRGESPRRDLLDFERAEEALRPFSRRYAGVQAIPLSRIIGTDSRLSDFDRDFLPRRRELAGRWRRVERAFPHGDFPPIVVSKLGDAYFVIDGHHRVAIARQQGMETIDAQVTDLQARWHLGPDADHDELTHAEQYRLFMELSGLAAARPEARFALSQPVGYGQMLDDVQRHGYQLMLGAGRALTPSEIAADWYESVYLNALNTFRNEGLVPRTTPDDLFVCVSERRRTTILPGGRPLGVEHAARQVLADDNHRPRRSLRLTPRGRNPVRRRAGMRASTTSRER
jgi:ParB/Sulfiredoxin domain